MSWNGSRGVFRRCVGFAGVFACAGIASAGNPFAVEVVQFDGGAGGVPGFESASSALGSATRFTSPNSPFPSVVSPFSPPFGADEIVSIGAGGSLTLRFESVIRDAANHAFGLDFIVFANAGFIETSYPNGVVGDAPTLLGTGAAVLVEASADGSAWETVQTRPLDLFPTLGYRDAGPFDTAPGSIETDFRVAMDPSLGLDDIAGLDYAGLVALYGQSGGGVGFDLGLSGLGEASFLRFTHAGSAGETFQIDAVSVIPAPATTSLVLSGACSVLRRRRVGA